MSLLKLFPLIFCNFFAFGGVFSLNIDTTNPIIISNHFDGSDSFFGTSVTLLEKDETSRSSESSAWVIVGTPKANSTHLKHKSLFEPGVLWRCSLGRVPADFCEVVVMDPTDNKYFDDDGQGYVIDRKDGGWLGGAVFNSNGANSRFVSCASRWSNQWLSAMTNFTEHYLMNGICYWRPTNDLRTERTMPDLPHNYRLNPIHHKDNQAADTEFIWAFGQAGFSIHITDDNQLLIGAPGMNVWKGGVIHFKDPSTPPPLQRNGQPDKFGGVFQNVVVSKSEFNPEVNHNNSYLGYAITSGKFMKAPTPQTEGKTQFAAGAPRGNNLMGKVIIFTFAIRGSKLNIIQEINGTGIGTYFGSVLCSVDVNNDGYDDLLIGAPQYSTKLNPKIGAYRAEPEGGGIQAMGLVKIDENGDEGRVFVYLSSATKLDKMIELKGGNKPGSRFGSAITSLGDINNDGFNDIAIGAPYENDGTGAIYIYSGSSNGIVSQYSQVIFARDLHLDLHGFGNSLSIGVDIDQNGYNDVAVGSYASAQTAILRTRPIVNVLGEIVTEINKLPLNATGFPFQACVSYTGKHAPSHLDISIRVTMDADAKPARVHIRESPNIGAVTKVYNFKNVAYDRKTCQPMNGIIVHKLSVTGSPIVIKSEVWLTAEKKAVNPTFYKLTASTDDVPKLSLVGPKFDSFCTECPVQDSASSDKAIYFDLPLELPCGTDNKCISDLRLSGSFLNVREKSGFVIGSEYSLSLQITVQNLGEAAISPALEISWKKINLLKIPSNCEPLAGIALTSDLTYICKFGEILGANENAELVLDFDTRDLFANERDISFKAGVVAKTASDMRTSPVDLDVEIQFLFEGDIFMTAKETTLQLSPESVNPFQSFIHTFEVGLDGVSNVEVAWIDLRVPVQFSSHLFIEITNLRATLDGDVLLCTRTQQINQNLEISNSAPTNKKESEDLIMQPTTSSTAKPDDGLDYERIERLRRSADDSSQSNPPPATKFGKNGVIRVDCSTEFVKCDEFKCEINKFKVNSRASIDFNMKIPTEDIRKFMKEQNVKALDIRSSGKSKISVSSDYEAPTGHKPDEIDAITKIQLDSAEVPKWVYGASFAGGFAILASLICCLWACGCFVRKKKPEEPPVEKELLASETKPLQSQTIHEEDESGSESGEEGKFSREEIPSPGERPGRLSGYDR